MVVRHVWTWAWIYTCCAPGILHVHQWNQNGWSRKSPKVWQTCLREATGRWRTHLPSVNAAVAAERECFQSALLVLVDFRHLRLVTVRKQSLNEVLRHRNYCRLFSVSNAKWSVLHLFVQMKISDEETLQNLTGRNISDYLVKTYAKIIGKR